MRRRATPRDLRHDASDEAFSAAMLLCQNPSGACSQDGYCHYGNCFQKQGQTDLEILQSRILNLEADVARLLSRGETA